MDDAVDRLVAKVGECDQVLAECDTSPDPVARRRVATALVAKAGALGELGRHVDCARVWEEASVRFADEPPATMPFLGLEALVSQGLALFRSDQPQAALDALDAFLARPGHEAAALRPRMAYALELKGRALRHLQRFDLAAEVDAELARRFQDASEPDIQTRVAFALMRQAGALLAAGRVRDAVAVSERLIGSFEGQDDPEGVVATGDVLLTHLRSLLNIGPLGVASVAIDAVVLLTGASLEVTAATTRRLKIPTFPLHVLGELPGLDASAAAITAATPGFVVDRRLRYRQTVRVSRVLIDRLDGSSDSDRQRITATARLSEAVALFKLGHLAAVSDTFASLTASRQPGVVEAFNRLAERSRQQGGALGEAGALAFLFQRAQTLGQGDRRIAKIAYEESLKAQPAGTPRTAIGRLTGRILSAGKPAEN
jgi:tetratricopeptide (TPR) repeat protein